MSLTVLIECSPRWPVDGVVVPLRLVFKSVARANFLGVQWHPAVVAVPAFESSLGFDGRQFGAAPSPQIGELIFALTAATRFAASLVWTNAAVTMKAAPWTATGGDPADGDFATIWTGQAEDIATGNGEARVRLLDNGQALRVAALAGKFGSTGDALLDGADALKDRSAETRVPRAWGKLLSIPGLIVDRANGIWLFAGNAATSVQAFYDGGAAFTLGVARANLAALQANVPAAGAVDYCLDAGGKFLARPWSTPTYPFTAAATFGSARAADIASAIVTGRTAVTFTAGTVAAFNALQGADCGLYLDDETSVAAALDRLFSGLGGWWRLGNAGTISLGRWGWSTPALTVPSHRRHTPERLRVLAPTRRRSLGYARNDRVHSEAEIARILLATDLAYADGTSVEMLKPAGRGATRGGNLIGSPDFDDGDTSGWVGIGGASSHVLTTFAGVRCVATFGGTTDEFGTTQFYLGSNSVLFCELSVAPATGGDAPNGPFKWFINVANTDGTGEFSATTSSLSLGAGFTRLKLAVGPYSTPRLVRIASAADAAHTSGIYLTTNGYVGLSESGADVTADNPKLIGIADNATRNVVTYSMAAPASPVNGDLWVDLSGAFAVFKLRSGGAWVTGANALTAYNALSGTPIALADINTTESSKLAGIAAGATRGGNLIQSPAFVGDDTTGWGGIGGASSHPLATYDTGVRAVATFGGTTDEFGSSQHVLMPGAKMYCEIKVAPGTGVNTPNGVLKWYVNVANADGSGEYTEATQTATLSAGVSTLKINVGPYTTRKLVRFAQAADAGHTSGIYFTLGGYIGTTEDNATLGANARNLPPMFSRGVQLTYSNEPLTSSNTAGVGAIAIAAHSLTDDVGTISYSGGTLSGLTPGTRYAVYDDDPGFAGGARTYVATALFADLAVPGRRLVGYITVPATTGGIDTGTGGGTGGGGRPGGGGTAIP